MFLRLLAPTLATLLLAVTPVAALEMTERPDFKPYFDAAGAEGTIVVYNLSSDRSFVYNRERARQVFPPGETIQILLSVLALESGAVVDPDQDTLPAAAGAASYPAPCNAPVTLRIAFEKSCSPAFEALVGHVGIERTARLVEETGYGNTRGIAQGDFWEGGDLRISAEGQVLFLEKLWREQLPAARQAHRRTKDIMFVEENGDVILRGVPSARTREAVWAVGWTENEGRAILFALNLGPESRIPAIDIVRRILATPGV